MADVVAGMLGAVYWRAQECQQPAEFVAIDQRIRAEQDPQYRSIMASVARTIPTFVAELDITADRLMTIDLSAYDWLVTQPPGRDVSVERLRILFLRTAIRLGFEWIDIVEITKAFFGQTLAQPPVPVVFPCSVEPFQPPEYDVARQSPGDWAAIADYQWQCYRAAKLSQIREWREVLIKDERLVEIPRPRKQSGLESGLKKANIADEQEALEWAVVCFFGPAGGSSIFADLARIFPDRRVGRDGLSAGQQTRRRAAQIRKRVQRILGALGLPMWTED